MDRIANPLNRRVAQSRERKRLAGFKRVEVLVPADKVELVKAYAANLREGSDSQRRDKVRQLIAKAYSNFRALCLDNIRIDPAKADLADAAIVAAALMHRGDAEAYKLGRQISKLAR